MYVGVACIITYCRKYDVSFSSSERISSQKFIIEWGDRFIFFVIYHFMHIIQLDNVKMQKTCRLEKMIAAMHNYYRQYTTYMAVHTTQISCMRRMIR